MIKRLNNFEKSVDLWLTRPETNAAGRLGLVRVLYAISMLLFFLPPSAIQNVANAPVDLWQPVPLLIWMPEPPARNLLLFFDTVLVVSLVFLLIGFRVRMMTLFVLISATLLAAAKYSFSKIDHSDTFMNTYVPMIMLFAPWGATYSLDAYLKKQRGEPVPDVTDDSVQYSWPFAALLWLLAIMFMISGLLKAIPPGQWLVDPELMRKFLKEYNLIDQPERLRYTLGMLPVVPFLLQLAALVFETFYPLAVINNHWRRFYVSSTVFFHIGTRITLGIWFVRMLPVYAFFFDLQKLYDRFFPKRLVQPVGHALSRLPNWGLILLGVGLAGFCLWLHHDRELYRAVLRTPRAFLFNNIWYVAAVLAAYGIARSLPNILGDLFNRLKSQTSPVADNPTAG